jgi:pectin methylesterase-like acyl-CoA thioesterase
MMQGCTIISIAQNSGFVTAQKREVLKGDTGFSILNSKVVGSGSVYLGRAWGNYSRVIFSYTYMDSLVLPEGWVDSMGNAHHYNLLVLLLLLYHCHYTNYVDALKDLLYVFLCE